MKISTPKLSDIIMQRLEAMILEGSFAPGQRFPAERDLALQFDVSRPSVREAIQKLEAKGLVKRKQGGGTFVVDRLQHGFTDPLFELIATHPESQLDLLEFRHALEGIAAYYAALRGTDMDFAQIQQAFARIADCQQDLQAEAEAVEKFHLAVAEASHNMVLFQLMRGMQGLIAQNIAQNFAILAQKDGVKQQVAEHRRRLLAAVIAGEPELARQASNEHLAFIEDTLLAIGKEENRQQRALRRIQQGKPKR